MEMAKLLIMNVMLQQSRGHIKVYSDLPSIPNFCPLLIYFM